jgi:hypothetical protein
MADDAVLEKLKSRVRTEGLGPLGDVVDPIVDRGLGLVRQGIETLRQSTTDHPWIAIYMALQAGYFMGRLSRHYAQH